MSSIVLVVERVENWPLDVPGVELISARNYLTDPALASRRGLRVFNLCRSYRYQSLGYYVSLLAEARSHKPLPSVATIQDLKTPSLVRFISEDLDKQIQRSLSPLAADRFVLSVYFGQNLALRHAKLSLQLFNLFPAPLLRAQFVRQSDRRWQLQSLRPIAALDIPQDHRPFVIEAAREYFSRRRAPPQARKPLRYDLAILVDPAEKLAPSGERALQRFARAAQSLGIAAELIDKDDYGRLGEYDALFIRTTTRVDHYTYRFSRRAAKEGLVVVDDPQSILRCCNKVFLAEALARARIPTPKTVIVHRDNFDAAAGSVGFPAILKLPDGTFSRSVVRVDDAESFRVRAREYLETSDLLVAQEFLPTSFDWRVGVLDQQVLFACRYRMVGRHWQIAKATKTGGVRFGATEAVALQNVPHDLLDVALQAANLMGDGLYGVDLKEKDGRFFVIEVNDNPNIDVGAEDAIAGEDLYRRVMEVFLRRIERRKDGGSAT